MDLLLSKIIYFTVRILSFTYRFRYVGLEKLEKAKKLGSSNSYLLGIWHQNLLSGILAQTGLKYVVIVSKSKDAEAVAYTCARLGHVVVRGSSKKGNVDKGGKAAKNDMIEILKSGIPGAVTVDGPKGPAKIVKPGIINMAQQSETPLVAYAAVPEKYWSFQSWDKFKLPKPFSRIVIAYGEPLFVKQHDEFTVAAREHKEAIDSTCDFASSQFKNWKQLSKKNS